MSRIYFHSEHGEAEVRGSERAYAGGMCSRLLLLSLGLDRSFLRPEDTAIFLRLFPADHYLKQSPPGNERALISGIETAITVGQGFFGPALNTALVMGSDAVKLLARLHGACEIHTYVEGPNRGWLADIIVDGRETGILRADMGWEAVVTFLRERDDVPVVTSYSVCERFPNAHTAKFKTPDDDEDAWYNLANDEQWRLALIGLRESRGLEMSPENWDDFYFNDGETGFDLLKRISEPSDV